MAAPSRPKASDKQGICKKLSGVLKKRYKSLPEHKSRPVLESMMYAICLEDATIEQAEAALDRLANLFHDLNEIRVSSVTELTPAFHGMEHSEWRAVQVRGLLQYVFEKNFAFEFEAMRKKTLEQAQKQLGKIRDLSQFVRSWTLQESLGSHSVPMDASMTRAAIWLGLVDVGSNDEQASTALRPVLRKTEAPEFCDLIRAFGTDPAFRKSLTQALNAPPEGGFDLGTAASRLARLFGEGGVVEEDNSPPAKAGKPSATSKAKPKAKEASASKPVKPPKASKKAAEPAKSNRPRSRS